MGSRSRANGEGSIYPYRHGYAAYAWVETPAGKRERKYVYGQDRDVVYDKLVDLQKRASQGPIATNSPTVGEYLDYWLREVIKPNRAPLTYSTYETFVRLYIQPSLGVKRLHRLRQRDVQVWINKVGRTCQCLRAGEGRGQT